MSNIVGTDGDDTLVGTIGADGNDYVHGNAGNDALVGDAGNDVIYGGDGIDKLYGGTGYDTITAFGAGDHLDFSEFGHGKHGLDVMEEVWLTDTTRGTILCTIVSIEVVLLEGVHGIELQDLVDGGHFIV
jgi:Ca2+-binding RTX toxin-like protein